MLWRNQEDFKSTLSTLKGLTSSQVHSTLVTSNCQHNKNSTTTLVTIKGSDIWIFTHE